MTFAASKFIRFLPSATMVMASEFLMDISDSVICGNLIGETGLGAINLMQGVFAVVTFVSLMVSIGSSVLFSTEVGAFNLERAKGYFTLGAIAALVGGLLTALVLGLVRIRVLESFGAAREVFDVAAIYWLWYLPAAVLQPITSFMSAMCYADGSARLTMFAYLAQLIGNCLFSVPLLLWMGPAGCALGTAVGSVFALLVLMLHFRRKGCLLGLSGHFKFGDLGRIAKTSIGDASKCVAAAVFMFTLNAYVIAKFGSECLPVLAVVVMVIGLAALFDGVGTAVQPLVGVYVGEKNTLLTRRVMNIAVKVSLLQGGAGALLLALFPELVVKLAGIDDPALAGQAALAVRLAAVSLPGLALVMLFNSYYVFIGREMLSTGLTILATCVLPVALGVGAGEMLGTNGMWFAIGLAPMLAYLLVAGYLIWQNGWKKYPLILDDAREGKLRILDLTLTPEAICEVSREVEDHLRTSGIASERASRAALLVEETLMVVRERNAEKIVTGEITLDLNDEQVAVTLRDDGEIFNLTDADAAISSLRVYLVSNLMLELPARRNLTTTGFNRNTFRL